MGVSAPSIVTLASPSAVTRSATADWNTAPSPPLSTITIRSAGSSGSPAPKTSYASWASSCGPSSSSLTSSVLIPPAERLNAKIPTVATNQAAKTIQRQRALHIATRTVHGSTRVYARGNVGR